MPHKANPTLAVLLHRSALASPSLAATLHLAAGSQVDERAAGAWHAEWGPLALLLRHAVTGAHQASDLLAGLQVRADQMAQRLETSREDVLAEARSMAEIVGYEPSDPIHTGLSDALVDEVLARASRRPDPQEETR